MPLVIAQVDERDLEDIAFRLDQAAMRNNGINQTIEKVLALQNKSRADFFHAYISDGYRKDRETFWKVIDGDTGDLVAAAWYSFDFTGQPPSTEDVVTDDAAEQSSDDAYLWEVMTKLFQDWNQFKKEHLLGRPHANLCYIATFPEHQRRGAATLLLNKGAERADEAGLDVYLQASDEGLRAYDLSGYEIMHTNSIDLREFGVEKTETRYCMRRAAIQKS